jgi:hypothetical protein
MCSKEETEDILRRERIKIWRHQISDKRFRKIDQKGGWGHFMDFEKMAHVINTDYREYKTCVDHLYHLILCNELRQHLLHQTPWTLA